MVECGTFVRVNVECKNQYREKAAGHSELRNQRAVIDVVAASGRSFPVGLGEVVEFGVAFGHGQTQEKEGGEGDEPVGQFNETCK